MEMLPAYILRVSGPVKASGRNSPRRVFDSQVMHPVRTRRVLVRRAFGRCVTGKEKASPQLPPFWSGMSLLRLQGRGEERSAMSEELYACTGGATRGRRELTLRLGAL